MAPLVVLDRERTARYRLRVAATDPGGRRAEAVVEVEVTDLNDNSPVFAELEYSGIVSEGLTRFVPGCCGSVFVRLVFLRLFFLHN